MQNKHIEQKKNIQENRKFNSLGTTQQHPQYAQLHNFGVL